MCVGQHTLMSPQQTRPDRQTLMSPQWTRPARRREKLPPFFLSEHMKTHTQLRPPAQKPGWILGLHSLPSRSKDCARPGRLPQPMALGRRFQPLGVLLIRRAERRTAWLGEPKCGAVTVAPQNPAYFTEAGSGKGPCSSPRLKTTPASPDALANCSSFITPLSRAFIPVWARNPEGVSFVSN